MYFILKEEVPQIYLIQPNNTIDSSDSYLNLLIGKSLKKKIHSIFNVCFKLFAIMLVNCFIMQYYLRNNYRQPYIYIVFTTGWHFMPNILPRAVGKILQIPLRQGGVHEAKNRQDLYVLNWKSSYDVMLFTCQNCQQHFVEF